MIIRRILNGRLNQRFGHYFYSQMRVNGHWHIEQLNERTILKLKGEKCSDFLQGLITNDINLLDTQQAIYAMFLNTKGRVLYDSIVYKTSCENSFLLECDVKSLEGLQKHLNLYKVRRKIEISHGEHSIWAIFQPEERDDENLKLEPSENCMICADPRLPNLGYRAVVPKDADLVSNESDSNINYKMYRYKLGIAEGSDELLLGKSFPLEMNCDYLNGVSFNKGCYIGQEVTARTHHTGVVRKRVMPLKLLSPLENLTMNDIISEESSQKPKTVGKLLSVSGNFGLGLMRVKETLTSSTPLKVGNSCLEVCKPQWWPPSEEYALKKNL